MHNFNTHTAFFQMLHHVRVLLGATPVSCSTQVEASENSLVLLFVIKTDMKQQQT